MSPRPPFLSACRGDSIVAADADPGWRTAYHRDGQGNWSFANGSERHRRSYDRSAPKLWEWGTTTRPGSTAGSLVRISRGGLFQTPRKDIRVDDADAYRTARAVLAQNDANALCGRSRPDLHRRPIEELPLGRRTARRIGVSMGLLRRPHWLAPSDRTIWTGEGAGRLNNPSPGLTTVSIVKSEKRSHPSSAR